MTVRYGDKARSGEPVGNAGQRQTTGGSAQTGYEQTFTSPGTWTWPGKVTHVEVLLVGGGGGSGSTSAPPRPSQWRAGGGGGGGVRMVYDIPVSAPVPITVGAGGTAGTFPLGSGGAGGDSAFGPITPPIPPSTYKVGGGGGGCTDGANPTTPVSAAPPDGGGAGGRSLRFSTGAAGGSYGMPSYPSVAAPGPSPAPQATNDGGGAGALTNGTYLFGGLGKWGYGFGGNIRNFVQLTGGLHPFYQDATAGAANTGNGAGQAASFSQSGAAGGSGIVIVRWWE